MLNKITDFRQALFGGKKKYFFCSFMAQPYYYTFHFNANMVIMPPFHDSHSLIVTLYRGYILEGIYVQFPEVRLHRNGFTKSCLLLTLSQYVPISSAIR